LLRLKLSRYDGGAIAERRRGSAAKLLAAIPHLSRMRQDLHTESSKPAAVHGFSTGQFLGLVVSF
jgi:hypothetical protein